jgi:hypothetical protein
MQRKDGPRRAFEPSSARSVDFTHVARLTQETQPCSADSLIGDLAEGAAPSWEAAWIDLGGEG